MKRFFNEVTCARLARAILALCATPAIAQTFTTLHSFDGADGVSPWAGLVQANNGHLYGTTVGGGADGNGTAFTITTSGTLTSFAVNYGMLPYGGLVQAAEGYLYGTTSAGGAVFGGTIFKITPSGTLTTLYSFCSQSGCADGSAPYATLIQAPNGNLYGTTMGGGANRDGTVFSITPAGTLTTLYSFCSQSGCSDGASPEAPLVQATNGDFYGTTNNGGGASGSGTVFKITSTGTLTTLYTFCSQGGSFCGDGANPSAGLVLSSNGNFYGTTYSGGANGIGTVFELTPTGTLTTLYSFGSQSDDGISPNALVEASNGDFYGTTEIGGANSAGTIFTITPSGTLTTLYSFCSQTSCTDGADPQGGLIQDTHGNFYGTTYGGGTNGDGTVFTLATGLGPFVESQPTFGRVGTAVNILGSGLTGATSVTFNGTAAVFKVVSNSEITTTVPAGASSGKIKVVTPSRPLLSNVPFQVP
jgi:uncharacterized repeat protein (TIGR03803 family)